MGGLKEHVRCFSAVLKISKYKTFNNSYSCLWETAHLPLPKPNILAKVRSLVVAVVAAVDVTRNKDLKKKTLCASR